MDLYFRTRDVGSANDYPAIGWMPPLPTGADRLWRQVGSFGSAELPQMVLSQHAGRWNLYLEGMDSGRTDSVSGEGGRVIRMSLCLSGDVSEGAGVMRLVSSFVGETLTKLPVNGLDLKRLFANCVKPGDPSGWKKGGLLEQQQAAKVLLAELSGRPDPDVSLNIECGWCGGLTQENIRNFLGSCLAVLTGKVEGLVLSLPYLRMQDVPEIQRLLPGESFVAVLSTDARDKTEPVIHIRSLSPSPSRGAGTHEEPKQKKQTKLFFIMALALVLAVLSMRSCSNTDELSTQKNNRAHEVSR